MKVMLADVYGFCFGVRRAVDIAEEASKQQSGSVDALGQLIHNNQEIHRLAAAGVRTINALTEVENETVIIRTHGAPPATFASLRARGLKVIDSTCPFVTKSQNIAARFSQAGYDLVVVGDAEHPEIKGIQGYCQGRFFVIKNIAELDKLPADLRPGLIAQTTTDEAKFLEIARELARRFSDMRVYNTVCSATHERQEAARVLAGHVDAIYVVGGRQSSNTVKLAEISRSICQKVFLIETESEIDEADLIGVELVGVTAGASTPDWLIERVLARLRAIEPITERLSA